MEVEVSVFWVLYGRRKRDEPCHEVPTGRKRKAIQQPGTGDC